VSADRAAGGAWDPEVRDDRLAARTRELADLLARRPELVGVHPPADMAADAARWCA
jgi:hypothetical protein